jgi:hypothetical protein
MQVINVDPKSLPGDNSRRIEIKTQEYLQVLKKNNVIFFL